MTPNSGFNVNQHFTSSRCETVSNVEKMDLPFVPIKIETRTKHSQQESQSGDRQAEHRQQEPEFIDPFKDERMKESPIRTHELAGNTF
jgi:hypothetical protein